MNASPQWLLRRIPTLTRTGQLSLVTESNISDLEALGNAKFAKYRPMIKKLDIRNTLVSKLTGLPPFSHVQFFIADGSKIATLEGFLGCFPRLTAISLKNTPVARNPNYRLELVVLFGNSLSSIDGKVISKSLARKAATYPESAGQMIDRGWKLEVPCPDSDDFEELCDQHNIRKEVREFTEDEVEDEFGDFEAIVENFRQRQEDMFNRAAAWFGFEAPVDADLAERISRMFGQHRICVDATCEDVIVQAVEDLCIRAKAAPEAGPSALEEEDEN